MKKKIVAAMLVGVMAASLAACGSSNDSATTGSDNAAETEGTGSDAVATSAGENQIIFGDVTETSGDVFPYWTNNASDYYVDKMIEGASVVEMTADGEYVYNDQVLAEEPEEGENEDGSYTWTFKIKDDLKWSNGDPITAKDYVFTALFLSSDELVVDLEASEAAIQGQYLKGFDAYNAGETDVLEGVHLIDDYTFSITVDAQFIPFFYGKALASYTGFPMYMAGWVPSDVDIEETEDGAKFTDNYTADYIGDTVDSFRWNPTACSGPYMFDNYDSSAYAYTIKINPNYVGNYEGKTPSIETVIYKYVAEDTMMDQLKTGAIDYLCQATTGDEITAGLDMVDEGGFDYINYGRDGYGKIVFKCNEGPTQFTEVRQAIAYLLDRNAFAQTFTGGFGTVANGPYGLDQWMVTEDADFIDGLETYAYSLDKAIEVLEAGGWVYNEDGSDYSGEGTRYKKLDDGTYMPLVIEWCSSENNSVSDLLVTSLQNNPDVTSAGMTINQTVVTFNELLDAYYNTTGDCGYNMLNMGEGFSVPYDVAAYYKIDGSSNYNGINDQILNDASTAMNNTEEGDKEAYLAQWETFMTEWNAQLPDLPLYSNIYHDFFKDNISIEEGYENDGIWDIAAQILYMTVN